MTAPTRNRWTAVIVLASLYVFYNAVELGIGDGGWPQIIGVPLGSRRRGVRRGAALRAGKGFKR